MALDEKLLEILACPNCHGEVECRGECRYRYPVRDDIPVMLIEEAEKPGTAPA
jgi:uncharacterized protein